MPENLTIKPEALEPLFAAWREPEHRIKRADGQGTGCRVKRDRRPNSLLKNSLSVTADVSPLKLSS
jgi:hypothetical protein